MSDHESHQSVFHLSQVLSKMIEKFLEMLHHCQSVCSVERVRQNLENFGLECKPTEKFRNARVLGLQLAEVTERVPTAEEVSSTADSLDTIQSQVGCTKAELF